MGFFRDTCFKVLYKSGLGNYLLFTNRNKLQVPVLVFHKIIPEYDQIWPGIHPRLFEEIIVLLKKHYRILPLNELYQKNEQELKDACFITFDDGYKDFLDYAYPILKKHNIHSTLFVLPNDITNRGHIWTSTIIFLVKHYAFNEIDEFLTQRNIQIMYSDIFDGFKLNLDITAHLCEMQQTERTALIKELQEKFVTDNRIVQNELLSFDELRKLDPALVDVASHSLTHPSFRQELDEEFINYEIKESKAIIEKELNTGVKAFAFPFAKYNGISYNVVKKVYRICFTRINEFVKLKRLKVDKDYIYDLPRFNIHHDSAEEVFFLINGLHKKLGR
jgi:peptidoglycan/xylan/chitin deacetylase (PgdA/CDA1 family)